MTQPTQEQINRAERIAHRLLPEQRKGHALWNAAQIAALAAIVESDARYAKLENCAAQLEDNMRRYTLDKGFDRRIWALEKFRNDMGYPAYPEDIPTDYRNQGG